MGWSWNAYFVELPWNSTGRTEGIYENLVGRLAQFQTLNFQSKSLQLSSK